MTRYWDGNESLPFVLNDGGRAKAGFKGSTGDCVVRAVSIASRLPYADVYAKLSHGEKTQRGATRASARNGVHVRRKWFKDYMASLDATWTPTMQVGQGCKVHLLKGELPSGRLVVSLSRHYTAVIDGVIQDAFDPSRPTIWNEVGQAPRMSHRCVYGYWKFP